MSTHFVCHGTEPLPHRYPSGVGQKTHGAVSQYENLNVDSKAHTQFPPPGWDFSQSSEDDSLPLCQGAPQPSWQAVAAAHFQLDPNLCVTPEKPAMVSRINRQIPQIDPDPLLAITPEKSVRERGQKNNVIQEGKNLTNKDSKSKQKVRFEIDSSSKETDADGFSNNKINTTDVNLQSSSDFSKKSPSKVYQPELYGDDDENFGDFGQGEDIPKILPSKLGRTVQYTVGKINDKAVYVPLAGPEGEVIDTNTWKSQEIIDSRTIPQSVPVQNNVTKQPSSKTRVISVVKEKVKPTKPKQDELDPIAASSNGAPNRKVVITRENQIRPTMKDYTYPFGSGNLEPEEHVFARPEYNSTLRMNVEIQNLKDSEIDVARALEKKLKLSESTKTDINEKAAVMVNTEGSTFQNLVSLEVPPEAIINQTVKTIPVKMKPVKPKTSGIHREPDQMEFFSPDLQRESVDLSVPGVTPPSEPLLTASHWRAFDLYHHNRVWDRRDSHK